MAGTVVIEDQIEIPLDLHSLADFRRWALSESFPDRGRIDFLGGRIEVDLTPKDLFSHGALKGEICSWLYLKVKQSRLGHLFTDSTRVSCPEAELSVEPDVVFVSRKSIQEGRVRLVPKTSGTAGAYVELEGPPEMVAEVVSDSSVKKGMQRLPAAYYLAGVPEFWLVDARGKELLFQIHRRGESAYEAVEPDSDGYRRSQVFGCRFRLDRERDEDGYWAFDLREKP